MDSHRASKKSKHSSSSRTSPPGGNSVQDPDLASSEIRHAISTLIGTPDIPATAFARLLESMTAPLTNTLFLEESHACPVDNSGSVANLGHEELEGEEWDWKPVKSSMDPEEWSIWQELLGCRDELKRLGVQKWEAHIPGLPNTAWEKSVYASELDLENKGYDFSEDKKVTRPLRCWFIRPLFHVNCYPSEYCWSKLMLMNSLRITKLLHEVQLELIRPSVHAACSTDPFDQATSKCTINTTTFIGDG
ncbi:hypothetical protein Hypma_001490 [Hypsizygus marmoreus]|uniref:Uncharacterized protein n=1 Tax=Hypsizygus marmoreus TaxID=39966 RepID=A0A369K617_HYPMA|nr:hypothetical protein Hypma_001490 [Hypsizygus marmoreus]